LSLVKIPTDPRGITSLPSEYSCITFLQRADSRLFSCEYRQQIIYKTAEGVVDAQTPVNSVFVHPIIGVEEEGKDLYDCLGELYLGGADIEYEGKKGHMMDLMDKFPPMLYIQMRVSC
jgi:ubiquitin carboxyl-terminal hydrolase 25/28